MGGEAVGTDQGRGPVARQNAAAQFPLSSQVCAEGPPSCVLFLARLIRQVLLFNELLHAAV